MLRNLETCNSRKPLPPPSGLEGSGGNTVVLLELIGSWRDAGSARDAATHREEMGKYSDPSLLSLSAPPIVPPTG